MLRKILLFPLLILSVMLSGCGGVSMVLKPDAVNSVKTVALIRAKEPTYRMMDLGNPAAALGVVGAIAVVVNGQESQKSLDGVIKTNNYSFSSRLTDEIAAQLEKSGFKVTIIDVARSENDLLKDYSAVDAKGADAILDVVVTNAGYVTEHFIFSPKWRPEARALIGMRAVKNNEVVYQETIMYGYHNPLMGGTDIKADPQFSYDKKEAVFEKGDAVVLAGLDEASKSIASHVAKQLRN